MPEPFTFKILNVSFGLGSGVFSTTGTSAASLSGLRISAKIVAAGGPSFGTMQAAVYGLPLSMMNELSTLGMRVQVYGANSVVLEAGDSESGMSVAFSGNIVQCWADMQAAPECCLQIVAHVGNAAAGQPIPVTSYPGAIPVATILQKLAQQGGFQFQNHGVTTKITNPYFSGTIRTQIYEAIAAAGCDGVIDLHNTVQIWPWKSTSAGPTVTISPQTGMVGYPAFYNQGVVAKMIYNPNARMPGYFTIQGSDITPANGTWAIATIVHDLESQTPNGQWFTTLNGYNPAFGPQVSETPSP